MSQLKLLPLALVFVAAIGCKDDPTTTDAGADAGGMPDTGEAPDSGVHPDAMVVDTGPGPCQRDQGGPDNRGCDPGEVCNLLMDPPTCVPGRACTTDNDCNTCSDLVSPQDCGHGYHLTAWCDPDHGNVCTRSRAPCEPCEEDSDCGRVDPLSGGAQNTCRDYGNGEKYCARPCPGCPDGFSCHSTENVCYRAEGCAVDPVICEQDPDGCPGRPAPSQICVGEVCEGTGGARCSTNNQPGALGICIGFCTENSDCTDPAFPICNARNGICIAGCTKGSCAGNNVCHLDGFCNPPCDEDTDCSDDPRYGPDSYCNIPPPPVRPPPRYYKGGATGYRDDYSCAPLGCEDQRDCAVSGIVCDKTQIPPACVPGCYERDDCAAGFACKDAPAGNYSEQECRALPDLPEGSATIGTCCDPGCQDLALDCGFNEFCCGEDKDPNITEPYENPASCLPVTSTSAQPALPGECFEMGADPWCRRCGNEMDCNMPRSGWVPGYIDVDGPGPGGLVNDQEFCAEVDGTGICTVTCNPDNDAAGVHTCPRLWTCRPLAYQCLQDADCNGLTCIGADPANMIPGACRCGENGAPQAACPPSSSFGAVEVPRCIEVGTQSLSVRGSMPGEFYCVAAFNCLPPALIRDDMTGETNYPESCGF